MYLFEKLVSIWNVSFFGKQFAPLLPAPPPSKILYFPPYYNMFCYDLFYLTIT